MMYVEFLRVRRALVVFTIVVASMVALTLIGVLSAHGSVSVGNGPGSSSEISLRAGLAADFAKHGTRVPLAALIFLAAYAATIMATVFGSYLASDGRHTPLSWTKPVSREWYALANFGVDAVGMVLAFVITMVIAQFVVLWALGLLGFLTADAGVWTTIALMSGIAFAYYGVVRALTVSFPGRGGAIAGASWAVAFVLILFAQLPLPSTFHAAFVALDFLNPLAYGTEFGKDGVMAGAVPLSIPARIACVWTLAIVSGSLAIVFYRRAEA